MAVADLLKDIGQGVVTAGKAAVPVLQRVAQVESGEAPQIDAEQRKRQQGLEDATLNAKSQQLEAQLEMGRKYGTLTPEQQQQYVDQITGLYSHPRHAGTLMEKLRQAIHPNGAFASGPQAPLPDAAPPGGTDKADQQNKLTSLAGADDEKKQQALKSIDWFKKNMLPQFPPDQQARKLNEYIDHINGITQGQEKPPKGMKAMEQGGVFFGIEDQDSGKQYLKAQLEPGGDAPPEAKQMYQAVQKGAADKVAQQDKKEKESEERQERQFGHALQMQSIGLQKALELGDYREAKKEVTKSDEQYQSSVDRASTMDKAAALAKKGDQQAMFAVLSNHIAMTLQQQSVSARPTKAMFEEAAGSLPFMQKITKSFDGDGYLSGLTLSQDQIDKMVQLAHDKVDTQKDHVDRVKAEYQESLQPAPLTGAKKVGQILPKTGAKPVNGSGWPPPAGAPEAPKEDGKVLKADGKVVAKSKGGQWGPP